MARELACQEDPQWKEAWLRKARVRMPINTRVRVGGDHKPYIGVYGKVVGYDLGCLGEWPMICVQFDTPIGGNVRDAFYCDGNDGDEIVKVNPRASLYHRLLARYHQHVDLKRDDRGFGLKIWAGPIYVEIYHDKPTKAINFRCLYGEE